RRVEEVARAVEGSRVLVVARDESARRLDRRLGPRRRGRAENEREASKMAGSHRRALYRRERGPSILTPSEASAILRFVIASGVQTWGTDVVALQLYWRRAGVAGYARFPVGWRHLGMT